jgi:hypothetical protein
MGQINKFRAAMSKAKGFARPSKFAVRLNPPTMISTIGNAFYTANGETRKTVNREYADAQAAVREMYMGSGKQIELFCSSVEMPGHDLQTQQQQHGSAPVRDMVTSHGFEGMITASFYLSEDLKERHFFEQWQRLAVNIESHKANFYDDYIGSMEIYQLSNGLDSGLPFPTFIDKIFDVDMAEYGIRASEVYPATISGIEYSYESGNQIATMAVGFNYREWRNLGNEKTGLRPYS